MKKTIISRYGEPRTLEELEDGNYIIHGKSEYMRIIGDEDGYSVDYEGGPYMGIGDNLLHTFNIDAIIKKIEHIPGMELPNCYKIIVK